MKKILAAFLFIAAFAMLLVSCKKDYSGDKAVVNTSTVGVGLTLSTTTLVLDSTKNSTTAITFTWPTLNYGYSADVNFTLQFDVPSDSFKAPINVAVGINLLTKVYTVKDFNALAFQSLGLAANTATTIAVRLKADVNANGNVNNGSASTIPSQYSNAQTITVTPYKIVVVYPLLYVPGEYQGWDPTVASAKTIASVKSDGNYEGYIYIPTTGSSFEFKITPAPNWNTSYGTNDPITLTSGIINGSMSLTGSNNLSLKLLGSGYYRINASTLSNTWSADKTTWGLIGDFNSFSTDIPMVFNATTNQWVVTGVNLTGGSGFKFRANADWNNPLHNFGVDNTGKMTYNASNIPVPVTGTYTVILDLSSPGNYSYTLKKQ